MEIIRRLDEEYAFGINQLHDSLGLVLKIKNWCKTNFGDKEVWERRLSYMTSTDVDEKNLGNSLHTLRAKIAQYEGIELNEIKNEDDKEIVRIVSELYKEYAFGTGQIHEALGIAKKIEKWCKTNFGDKEVWERRLPNGKSEDEEEKKLGTAFNNLKARMKKYEGIELDKIEDEDTKEIVKILRRLDKEYAFGIRQSHEALGIVLKIENWCKTKFGDKEAWERRLPYSTSIDVDEKILGTALRNFKIKIKKYEGIELNEIKNENDKEIVKIIKRLEEEYAFGIGQIHESLGIALKIENWCTKNFGDKEVWERRLPNRASKNVDESKLGAALSSLKTRMKKYEGIELEQIKDEEDREVVKIVRRLDREYAFGIRQIHESLGIALKIENWCKINFGDKEAWERRLPNRRSEDEDEKKLGTALDALRARRMKKYEGLELEQIEDEDDKKIVKILRRLDEEYNPKKVKQVALSKAKQEFDSAKQKNEDTIELEKQVEAQLNYRGKNYEEQ